MENCLNKGHNFLYRKSEFHGCHHKFDPYEVQTDDDILYCLAFVCFALSLCVYCVVLINREYTNYIPSALLPTMEKSSTHGNFC